jgi:hypothetical protein
MQRKSAIALVGLSVAALSVVFLSWYLLQGPLIRILKWTVASADVCKHPITSVEFPHSVLSDGESATLRVILKHDGTGTAIELDTPKGPKDCTAKVELFAPNFDYEPKAERSATLPADRSPVTLTWVVAPKKVGRQEMSISAEDDEARMRVTVISALGLTSRQLAFGSMLTTFLGSPCTFPWIYEKLREARKKRSAKRKKKKITPRA